MEKDKLFTVAPPSIAGWPIPGSSWGIKELKNLPSTLGNILVLVLAIDISLEAILIAGGGGAIKYSLYDGTHQKDTNLDYVGWWNFSAFIATFAPLEGPFWSNLKYISEILEKKHELISKPWETSEQIASTSTTPAEEEEAKDRFDLDV
jgi:hypothetical protein